jgi:ABC-type proline/glycine betaine transport system substrate-binding protein
MEKKETKQEISLPVGVTPEMVKAWKERYGEKKVCLADLPKDDDGIEFLTVVVRVPDRKTMSEFEKFADKNPDKAKEIMVNACVLSNKEEVKADDGLFLAAFDATVKLMPVRAAIIKNL